MKSVSTNSKSWKTIIGLSGIAILSCGICCLPLIASMVASVGTALSLGVCLDELSYWHFLGLAGLGSVIFLALRWRQKAKAKTCQQECRCEDSCETR